MTSVQSSLSSLVVLDIFVLCISICISACIRRFVKEQGPNISMIATDVIKCYQMTDTVQWASDLKPLCFSNISSSLTTIITKLTKTHSLEENTSPFLTNVFLINLVCADC